jgi:hypothetical protein
MVMQLSSTLPGLAYPPGQIEIAIYSQDTTLAIGSAESR